MATQVQVANITDFTGGLNLRADQFALAPNELADVMNMDVDPRGGIRQRRGVEPHPAGATAGNITPHSLTQYHTKVGNLHQIIVGYGTTVAWATNNGVGGWKVIASAQTVPDPFSAVNMNSILYIQNGTDKPFRWDGAAAARMNQAYSNDFTAPGSGNMPIGKYIAVFHGHTFVANTTESGTAYPNRIRFSHPNVAEAYRSIDWFDVEAGKRGDEILALVPFQDHMLVFKRHSIAMVTGYDAASFAVSTLSNTVGITAPRALAVTPSALYWFAMPSGVMVYDGRGMNWAFEKLWPLIDDTGIYSNRVQQVTMAWLNNRIWVSVPWMSTSYRTFVLDPTLGKEGGWTQYDLKLGPMMEFSGEGVDQDWPLAAQTSGGTLLRLEGDNYNGDNFGSGLVPINSYFAGPWVDFDEPARRKRFKRPWIVWTGESDDQAKIECFYDYDSGVVRKTFFEAIGASTVNNMVWDDPVMGWDAYEWAYAGTHNRVARGSTIGVARAVQLKFTAPPKTVRWGVNSVSLLFIPKKVR